MLSVLCGHDIVCLMMAQGGLKAVMWADVFQAFVMLAALLIVMIKGSVDVGGLGVLWTRSNMAHRIEFFKFD